MAALSRSREVAPLSLAIPSALLLVLAGLFAIETGLLGRAPSGSALDAPAVVTVVPRDFRYRVAGEFFKNGYAVDGPV
ncbi:formylglycine-generating enzyme family protein, partial [Sinorhizobium medicae]